MTAAPSDLSRTSSGARRSAVALAALGCAVAATVGLLGLVVGYFAEWKGFGNDGTDSNTATSDVLFFLLALGGTVAVVCAIVALVRSRRSGHDLDRDTGRNVLIGFAVAVVVFVGMGIISS
jgi:zinc transporter ZupT